jgi:hypothetical protein
MPRTLFWEPLICLVMLFVSTALCVCLWLRVSWSGRLYICPLRLVPMSRETFPWRILPFIMNPLPWPGIYLSLIVLICSYIRCIVSIDFVDLNYIGMYTHNIMYNFCLILSSLGKVSNMCRPSWTMIAISYYVYIQLAVKQILVLVESHTIRHPHIPVCKYA